MRKSVLGLTRLLQVAAALLAENAPQGDIKIDWQVTERNHIFGRESAAHKKYTNPLTALGGLEFLLLRLDFLGPHQPRIWHAQTRQNRSHFCRKTHLARAA